VSSDAEVFSCTLLPEDEFLVMGCDGLWEQATSQEVVDFVKQRIGTDKCATLALSSIASELVDSLMAHDVFNGTGLGCDNMTCVIVNCADSSLQSTEAWRGA